MENTVANMMDQQYGGFDDTSGADGYEVETVTLSENGEYVSVTEQGVQDSGVPDAENPSGDAAQTNERFTNQQQINQAIGQRLHAERQKYQKDIDLSGKLRSMFNGMSDDDIVAKIRGVAANDYASQKNIPLAVAEEVLDMRSQHTAVPQTPAQPNTSPNIEAMARDAKAIEQKYGVNLVQIIAESPDLQRRVFGEGVPLNDILIEHLQSNQPRRRVPAPTMTPNGSGSASSSLSDTEYQKIKEQLRMGKKVRR